ncbi:MAG: hypothetical protein DRQ65_06325 [Gammaproteobacteria bacterium]|nr:MAG: hypothetical protein DRQ65_06325 [Gammaproteobacteria bacterium]RLA55967.1 MAG: hypothetical protein DRQ98_03600 [Gammaproteobacteria bacterium]
MSYQFAARIRKKIRINILKAAGIFGLFSSRKRRDNALSWKPESDYESLHKLLMHIFFAPDYDSQGSVSGLMDSELSGLVG